MNKRENSHLGRGSDDGSANIAARADDDIRTKLLEDGPRLQGSFNEVDGRLGVFQHMLAIKAADGNEANFIAVLRNDLMLHAPFCADKQDFTVGIFFLYFFCNCNGGIYMSARAAACHNHSHMIFSNGFFYLAVCLEIFSRMPAEPMKSQSALPP